MKAAFKIIKVATKQKEKQNESLRLPNKKAFN